MDKKLKFGLIGRTLKHSYSKSIHALLGDYSYDLVELEPQELEMFVKKKEYDGFNVTIPYKSDIIKYLDEIDSAAEKIGAVNTVVRVDGKLKGYNTDFYGMIAMLNHGGIEVKDKSVMVLGSGGTSKTATAVLEHLGAKDIITVSRSGEVNYQNCYEKDGVQIIINTTPVGMYPNNYNCPVEVSKFPLLEGVADVVYNPAKTLLTFTAENKGIKTVNGLYMLVAQAKYARDKFMNKQTSDKVIDEIYSKLFKENQNIVLVGMPGSGKSTVGKEVAKRLGREFIDTDSEIEKLAGKNIPTIFKECGEKGFRELESKVIGEVGKSVGKVIATGGGVVKNAENYFPLKQNGKIFFLERDLDSLATNGRPLSKDLDTVKALYLERKDMYDRFKDYTVNNDGDINAAVKGVIDKL